MFSFVDCSFASSKTFFFMFFFFSSNVFFIITSTFEFSKIFVKITSRRRAISFKSKFKIIFSRSNLMMLISKFFNSLKKAIINRCVSFFFLKNFVFFLELFNVNQRFIEINVNLNRNSFCVFQRRFCFRC